MKWSLSQLKKYRDEPFKIDESIDLTEFLKANNQDVRNASPVSVTGKLELQGDEVLAHLKNKRFFLFCHVQERLLMSLRLMKF
ncbi:hypothetical protein MFLO_07752 [Listeria floridensis FSL S10-1187]|uniref:Uncharacterized protein n=1 Tax=Listeria floridensis FSL S10-1187 TaxID=1265817 RepID=A0ABN0RFK3_9LIST|nr:hypothetical protein MFLO_07752 [Listeria floridensis FSL S10-1187]